MLGLRSLSLVVCDKTMRDTKRRSTKPSPASPFRRVLGECSDHTVTMRSSAMFHAGALGAIPITCKPQMPFDSSLSRILDRVAWPPSRGGGLLFFQAFTITTPPMPRSVRALRFLAGWRRLTYLTTLSYVGL